MADPREGVAPDGTIQTGARRSRVPALFEPVLQSATILASEGRASLYVYGSVATGTAVAGSSDVDLLSIDLTGSADLSARLSEQFRDRCRAVEVAATEAVDFVGDDDEAYGNRVFLRHYCVHLTGADPAKDLPPFPADARAARGFNGDIDRHLRMWREQHEAGGESVETIGVRVARKTLLAVAGMVSVHDHIWTTDRSLARRRWSEIEPALASGLARLHEWVTRKRQSKRPELDAMLDEGGLVPVLVERFADVVGLWR